MTFRAASFGQGAEIINVLLKYGADLSLRNSLGETPAEEARRCYHDATAMILERSLDQATSEETVPTLFPSSSSFGLDFSAEEMRLKITTLERTLEEILEQRGVNSYVKRVTKENESLKLKIKSLEHRNLELHSFLKQNDKNYARSGEEFKTVEGLQLEVDSLTSEVKFERAKTRDMLERKNKTISKLNEELEKLYFQLDIRKQLRSSSTFDEEQRNTSTSSNLSSPPTKGTSLPRFLYDVFWNPGDTIFYEEDDRLLEK